MQKRNENKKILFSLFLMISVSSFSVEEIPMLHEVETSSMSMEVKKEESRIFVPHQPLSSETPQEEEYRFIDMAKEERYEEVREKINKTSALGSAMGAIDLGSTPAHKIRLGAGIGNTAESQAVAVGVGYAPTDRFKINTKISTSTESFARKGISFGASYDLDI